MDKKLPGIFVNKIEKKINNNNTVYYSKANTNIKDEKQEKNDIPVNIRKKIQTLFKSTNYIYKLDTEITLKDKVITKRIIGYNERDVITFDNELIPIESIVDIEMKK